MPGDVNYLESLNLGERDSKMHWHYGTMALTMQGMLGWETAKQAMAGFQLEILRECGNSSTVQITQATKICGSAAGLIIEFGP